MTNFDIVVKSIIIILNSLKHFLLNNYVILYDQEYWIIILTVFSMINPKGLLSVILKIFSKKDFFFEIVAL